MTQRKKKHSNNGAFFLTTVNLLSHPTTQVGFIIQRIMGFMLTNVHRKILKSYFLISGNVKMPFVTGTQFLQIYWKWIN